MLTGDQFDVESSEESLILDQFLFHEIVRHFQTLGIASDLVPKIRFSLYIFINISSNLIF